MTIVLRPDGDNSDVLNLLEKSTSPQQFSHRILLGYTQSGHPVQNINVNEKIVNWRND